MPPPTNAERFELGDVVLQHGATLRDAWLGYTTYGELNADRSNAVVYPTWFSGWHTDNEWLIGPGHTLDPEQYFVIVPNMLGNGISSSPSNTPPPYDRARFPGVTFLDQVDAQYRLVTERFGIESLALVTGWSMGAAQTYQWAVRYPEMVQRAAPFCGSAVTADHNKVFLYSLAEAMRADATFDGGWYDADDLPVRGLRAFARIYAGWGFSQAFYWQERWRDMGYSSLQDFLVGFWEGFFLDGRDPNDLLAMLWTWEHGDVGNTPGFDGDTAAALRSIRCPLLSMPAEKDLYFPPEDEAWSSQFIEHGEVRVIPGVYGHFAGNGENAQDTAFVDAGLADLLARPGYTG
ncbi:alpha/beta fold hydrolase [Pseudonocardia phyllosphaerae]|uniref:alpha/beta fold hydrolase n=1 Tax=Pseudonocardia phyllosphaerae TaxID=3390502 RepID=UPI00397C50A9